MAQKAPWWQTGIIYQIYPRSFADSNGDGIGDLNGIRDHLDYLKDLGVDCLWLSPIFPSPDVDFGYDVSDYYSIDPKFGTMADFEALLKEAHQKGLHIILDLVMNHTSDEHVWFKSARSSRKDAHHDWYIWRDSNGGKKPNNWQSVTGGSGWDYVSEVNQYYFHMFYKQQPDLNWRNGDLQEKIFKVFRFWLEKGVDGYRLDVFNLLYKDEQFRNNPLNFGPRPFNWQKHIHDVDLPEMRPLLRKLRQITDEKAGRYLVGEPFTPEPPLRFFKVNRAKVAARYCRDDQLHATFCFDLLSCSWNAGEFKQAILEWEKELDDKSWPTQVLGNHDNARLATRCADDEFFSRSKAAALMLLTLRGTPFIYYGDEIGMQDIRLKRNEIKDPVGRRYWPAYRGRDGCRAPMQWSDGPQAGFTQGGHPWLPIHPDHVNKNVKQQQKDKNSLLNYYKNLIQLRKSHQVLIDGKITIMEGMPPEVLGYLRDGKTENALMFINFSPKRTKCYLQGDQDSKWDLLLSTSPNCEKNIIEKTVILEANEAIILIQKRISDRQ
jgi:alpha-glucosidase